MNFPENKTVGFDENLAVVSRCDLQQSMMLQVATTPEAIVCKVHQKMLTWSPIGK